MKNIINYRGTSGIPKYTRGYMDLHVYIVFIRIPKTGSDTPRRQSTDIMWKK